MNEIAVVAPPFCQCIAIVPGGRGMIPDAAGTTAAAAVLPNKAMSFGGKRLLMSAPAPAYRSASTLLAPHAVTPTCIATMTSALLGTSSFLHGDAAISEAFDSLTISGVVVNPLVAHSTRFVPDPAIP